MNNSYYNSPFYNMDLTQRPIQPNQMVQPQQNLSMMKPVPPQPVVPPAPEPNIVTGGFKFSVYKDDERPLRPTDIIVDENGSVIEQKKRKGRPRKSEQQSNIIASTDMVKANPEDPSTMPTMYTYQETTNMLRGTMVQIDQLAAQVKQELDNVVSSRTLKSKYNIMVGLSSNLGELIGTKITAIKEINNAISKSNDMDYKKAKDAKAEAAGVNDDKYLMDMYNAFIQNPAGTMNALGPNSVDATLMGSTGIVRASTSAPQQGFAPETGYLSYVANMTPEQRLMTFEDNPNVKLCLIYDAATNNKVFQYMDMSTGQAIPGLPSRDPMFLEDTTIDLKNKIAKNINLNETYPVIVINDQVVKEY